MASDMGAATTGAFDDQPTLENAVVALRPLTEEDYDGLYAVAGDAEVWAQHPSKDRWKAENFRPYFEFLLKAGGTLTTLDQTDGRIIGCTRYYVGPDHPDAIAVGFTFLGRAYWGGRRNLATKTLVLDHAFAHFPEVWFHIGPDNTRSRKAVEKLGALYDGEATLDLSGSPALLACYRLTRAAWAERRPSDI